MRKATALLLALLMAICLIPAARGEAADANELSLLAINVRKADALLLRCGSCAYLIDTGTKESYAGMYRVLQAEGISRLTGVILTHTDKDHCGGLEDLIQSDIEIENVYASAYYNKKKESKHPAVKALKGTGREVIFLAGGDTLPMDGGTLTVIGPIEKDDNEENNNSLVMLAEGGGGSILLAGDMEIPEEECLLEARLIPHADVLKVGNHGDGDASSAALIEAVSPSVAVISTNSEDKPDTPSPRVLRLLEIRNTLILCTEDTENGVLVTIRNGEIQAKKI